MTNRRQPRLVRFLKVGLVIMIVVCYSINFFDGQNEKRVIGEQVFSYIFVYFLVACIIVWSQMNHEQSAVKSFCLTLTFVALLAHQMDI